MRFFLLSKADLFGNVILNRLLAMLCPRHEVMAFLSDSVSPEERGNPLSGAFVAYARDFLLDDFFPALDALPLRGGAADLLSFAGLAGRYGVPMWPLGGEVGPACEILVEGMRGGDPDVLLCCRHDFVIPAGIYGRARHGAYNTHSSALPDYRGPFCSFWTMLHREEYAACTLHTLKPKVDTGDIVAVGRTRLDYRASLLKNLVGIYGAGLDAFEKLLPALERGPLAGIPQPDGSGRYYRQPGADDCRRFAAMGCRLVDPDEYRELLRRYLPDPDDEKLLDLFSRRADNGNA